MDGANTALNNRIDEGAGTGRLAGYRLLRRLASGERADVFLATAESATTGLPRLLVVRVYAPGVDPASIGTELEAMSESGVELLPRLHDVAALDDGRICVAVERIGPVRLSALLLERRLAPGEAVTVLAPLAVAVDRLAEAGFVHTGIGPGAVQFDETGRPRLLGLGGLERLEPLGAPGRTERLRRGYAVFGALAGEVLAASGGAPALDALIAERSAVRPFAPFGRELERALFAWADPVAVAGAGAGAPGVAGGGPARSSAGAAGDPATALRLAARLEPSEGSGPARPRRRNALFELSFLPDDLVARLADAADRSPGAGALARLRARLAPRRSALVVGGLLGAAVLVVVLTLVPPGAGATTVDPGADAGGAAPTGAEAVPAAGAGAETEAEGSEETGAGAAPAVAPETEPVEAARLLLAERERCLAELALDCLGAVDQPGSAIEAADVRLVAAAQQGQAVPASGFRLDGVELAGEMGDAVLLTVPREAGADGAEREPASLLMVRGEAGWRLRELFG